jgi:hypothetical protein
MAHVVTRTIKGKQYSYLEESYRDPVTGKPKKRIIQYLGRVDGGGAPVRRRSRSISVAPPTDTVSNSLIGMQFTRSYGVDWDAIAKQEIERMDAEDKARAEREARLFADIGLATPKPFTGVPVEKATPTVQLLTPVARQMPSDAQDKVTRGFVGSEVSAAAQPDTAGAENTMDGGGETAGDSPNE